MTKDDRPRVSDEALALRAEAQRLRDLAMGSPNLLKAIGLSMEARRYERLAKDLIRGGVGL